MKDFLALDASQTFGEDTDTKVLGELPVAEVEYSKVTSKNRESASSLGMNSSKGISAPSMNCVAAIISGRRRRR